MMLSAAMALKCSVPSFLVVEEIRIKSEERSMRLA